MAYALFLAGFACTLYLALLLARMLFDWLQALARGWRPAGLALVTANVVYGLTDPPIKALGRVIRPIRLGGVTLDVGFLIVFFVVVMLNQFLPRLALSVI